MADRNLHAVAAEELEQPIPGRQVALDDPSTLILRSEPNASISKDEVTDVASWFETALRASSP